MLWINGTYIITVTALNGSGESDPSNSITITVEIPPNPPDSPTISTSTQIITTDNIIIEWNTVIGASSYNVYVDDVLNETTAGTSQKVILGINGTYVITVTAVSDAGESDFSNEIVITVEISPEEYDPSAFNDFITVFLSTGGALVLMILLIIKGRKPE